MALPVSMEDTELFPHDDRLNANPGKIEIDLDAISQVWQINNSFIR